VERAIGLARPLTGSNHDGLVIASWMLEAWPEHLVRWVESLDVPCPRKSYKRWQYLDPQIRCTLEVLLGQSLPQHHSDQSAG
jgi:hypothetical protein